MKKNIYIKTEPAGEIGIGKLNETDINSIKNLLKSKKIKDSDFITSPYEYTQDVVSGVFVGDKGEGIIEGSDELPKYKCIKTICPTKDYGYEDGWYLINSSLSKCSIEFDFNIEDGDFDINELEIHYTAIWLAVLENERYGELEFNILSDFIYKGRSIDEYHDAELIDRGYDNVVYIVEVKDGDYDLIYCSSR